MKRRIWFTVPGQPIGKARPRFARRGRFVQVYNPSKTEQYEQLVRLIAKSTYSMDPIETAIAIHFSYYFSIPKSFTKTKRNLAVQNLIHPIIKPDWDNLGKLSADAMNGLIYKDDCQIIDARVQKFYSLDPRAELLIWEV
jgi:Holliday junction resolvase RusA-like endonuclease